MDHKEVPRKFFKEVIKERKKVKSLSRVRLFATPWTVAYQAPFSMGFSILEYGGYTGIHGGCLYKKRTVEQTHTEELYKKDLHDPDNHSGVTTHLEPDILEYEVK